MGPTDDIDALGARPRDLWVPVHLGGGDVSRSCERLSVFLQTGRTGLGDTLPHATTLQSDLMGSGDKRRGLRIPWEGAVPSVGKCVGRMASAGVVYNTLDGKGSMEVGR